MDKSSILENLINYYTNGNKARFAAKIGVSPQLISTWISRGTFNAEILFTKCEGVNPSWLLTGEGEMLLETAPQLITDQSIHHSHHFKQENSIACTSAEQLELVRLKERIKTLEATLEAREQNLKDKDERIADLKETIAILRENNKVK